MAEYIEREAALIICETEYQERVKMQDWCGETVAWNIGHAIKAIRPADVAPVVHGRWVDGECGTFCTNCNRVFDEDFEIRREVCKKLLRCPNCGARMDG